MREFTKSMTSYTWAMSLFGLQQMINVFRPAKATQAFDNVTKATEEEFSEPLKATFRAGDNLQQGFVDMTFGMLTLGMFERGGGRATTDIARQTGEALRQGGRAVNQAVNVVSQTVQTAASAAVNVAPPGGGWAATPRKSPDPTTPPRRGTGPNQPTTSAKAPPSGRQEGWGPMPTQGSNR